MRAARARFDFTPTGDIYLGGYRHESRLEPALGVHDGVYGNAILLEHEGDEVFLVSLDLVEIEEEMADEVKAILASQLGAMPDHVLITATHDHSSTATCFRDWWTGKADESAYRSLIDQIVDAYRHCRAALVPVTARYGTDTVLGYYGNRNHPGEAADNEITVLRFDDAAGAPVAVIVAWAVHSTVLPADNRWLTGDLAGAVSEALASTYGVHPLMLNGAAGDCSNRHQRQGQDFDELARVSAGLAEAIAAIGPSTPIALGSIRSRALVHTVDNDDFHLDAHAWVVDCGALRLFAFPGELGSAFGPQLRASHPQLTLVAGYTNGYYAYWMPQSEYGLSFETLSSRIPAGHPEQLIAELIAVGQELDAEG